VDDRIRTEKACMLDLSGVNQRCPAYRLFYSSLVLCAKPRNEEQENRNPQENHEKQGYSTNNQSCIRDMLSRKVFSGYLFSGHDSADDRGQGQYRNDTEKADNTYGFNQKSQDDRYQQNNKTDDPKI